MHEDDKQESYSKPASDSSEDENWSETYGSSDDEDWSALGGSRTPGKRKNYTPKYKTNRKSNGSAHMFKNLGYQGPHTNGNYSPASSGGNIDETVKQKLHEIYLENQSPACEEKEGIAQKLGIDYHQVHNWFNKTQHALSEGPSSSPVPDNSNKLAITVNPRVNSLPKKRGRPRKTVAVTQANEGSRVSKINCGAYQTILPMPNVSNNCADTKLSLPRKQGRRRKIVAEAQVEEGSMINQIDYGAYKTTLPMQNMSNPCGNTELTAANAPLNQSNLSAYQSSLPMPNVSDSAVNTESTAVNTLHRKRGRPRKIVTQLVQVEKRSAMNKVPKLSNNSVNTGSTSVVNVPRKQGRPRKVVSEVEVKKGNMINQIDSDPFHNQATLPLPNISNSCVTAIPTRVISLPKKRGRPRKIVPEIQGSIISQIGSGAYQTTLPMPNISNTSVNTQPTAVCDPPNQINLSAYQTSLPMPNTNNSFIKTETANKSRKKEKMAIEIPLKEGHSIDQIDKERKKAITRELMKMKQGR